ncbi:MAG: type II secretion system F family protein [Candidatus Baltobacteraceae bacterium]
MADAFHYTARDGSGALIQGTLQCAGQQAALSSLHERALFVTSLIAVTSPRGRVVNALRGRASHTCIAMLFRSLATMVKAGVPISRALEVAAGQTSSNRLREALRSVLHDVQSGYSLSDSLKRYPNDFTALHTVMVRAGELGGALDIVLERLATSLEKERALRKRVAAALAYPAFVAGAGGALVLFLVASIVPMFQSMYEQMRVPLPPATALLIRAAAAFHSPWAAAAFVALPVSIIAVALHARRRHGAVAFEDVLMNVPLAGAIVRKSILARFAHLFGTLLRSGVDVVAAIETAAAGLGSTRYASSLADLRRALGEGAPISGPLSASPLYDGMFVQLIRVGEETGTLDAMLLQLADYYAVDVEAALSTLSALLEPALILLLGGAVAAIVSAIFIPLYSLIGSIR